MVIKIKLTEHDCLTYLKWKEYVRVFHDNLLQTGIYCEEANPSIVFVNLKIQNDVSDPGNVAVVVPNA